MAVHQGGASAGDDDVAVGDEVQSARVDEAIDRADDRLADLSHPRRETVRLLIGLVLQAADADLQGRHLCAGAEMPAACAGDDRHPDRGVGLHPAPGGFERQQEFGVQRIPAVWTVERQYGDRTVGLEQQRTWPDLGGRLR
jgi:hypothetical protein